MTQFASNTKVSVDKSISEIRRTVQKYGGINFVAAEGDGRAVIMFEACDRRVQFELPLPRRSDFAFREKYRKQVEADPSWQNSAWEQACRTKWRALALCIKAKLEAVESEISDFQSEFLAYIAVPGQNGPTTVGKWLKPQLEATYQTGTLPPLLESGR